MLAQAYEYFRVRVYSDAFRRSSFEPVDEDAFEAVIRTAFSEDSAAQLEPPTDTRVLVEHRHPDLRFHRRWGWWTMGALGMAATLHDLHREGVYSVADMAMDMTRFLNLVGQLGRALSTNSEARVVIGLDPGRLRPEFDPSDVLARKRPLARLAGVQGVARPTLTRTREERVEGRCPLGDLSAHSIQLAAESIVSLLRRLHGARISTDAFEASIPVVMETVLQARLG